VLRVVPPVVAVPEANDCIIIDSDEEEEVRYTFSLHENLNSMHARRAWTSINFACPNKSAHAQKKIVE
jgi:hypothetical protein